MINIAIIILAVSVVAISINQILIVKTQKDICKQLRKLQQRQPQL